MAKAASRKRKRSDEDDEPTGRRRRSSSSSNNSGGSFKVDFRDATSGGGSRRFPEGDYKVKITKAERSKSQAGNSQIKVTYEFVEPEKYEGKTLIDYLTLTRKAAWRIGNLFDAVGIKWSQKVMEFKTGKLIGKELGITLADDEYNKKIRSKVADYLDLETIDSILSGGDVDDDEDEDEDDEDTDDLEAQLADMDRDELKEYIKDEGLDVKVGKKTKDAAIRKAILAASEEDEDEDEDDDEDEDLEEFDDDDL